MPILDWFGLQKKEAKIPIVSKFQAMINRTPKNRSSLSDPADYNTGWIFASIRAIAEGVAGINLILVRTDKAGNREIIVDHPAITSLRSVNDFFTFHQLMERLQANLEFRGNEYWYIQPSKDKMFEIYPLVSQFVQPMMDQSNYVKGYAYKLDNSTINLNPDQVIHFKNFNPKSDLVGASTLSAALDSADTDRGARDYNRSFFENSGRPDVILEYPQELNPEEIAKLKQAWTEEFAGVQNGYKTAVASDGLKITTLNAGSHADMEFIEQRRFSRDEILAIFRVPKIVVGIMEDVNRASAEAAIFAFMEFTICPKMRRIVDTLNEFYLPLFGDSTLRFEFTNKPPEDKQMQTTYFQTGISNGWLSPNDVRRAVGLPELKDGESVFLPYNLAPFSQPAEQAKQVGKPSTKGISYEVDDIADAVVKMNIDAEFETKGSQKNKAQITRQMVYERQFKSAIGKLFTEQKARCKEALAKELNTKGMRKRALKAQMLRLLDKNKEVGATIDLMTPLMGDLIKKEGQAALDYLGLKDDYADSNPDLQKFIEDSTSHMAETMTDTTIQDISDSILEGLDAGEAIDGLTARIEDATAFDDARAEMIARTETTRAGAQAELDAWDSTGLVTKIIWYTGQDERVCEECDMLHGTEVDMGEDFISSIDLMEGGEDDYWGDGINSPPRHPQCRCTLLPVVDESKHYIPRKKRTPAEPTDEEKMKAYLSTK